MFEHWILLLEEKQEQFKVYNSHFFVFSLKLDEKQINFVHLTKIRLYLGEGKNRVLGHWACYKVETSTADEAETARQVVYFSLLNC